MINISQVNLARSLRWHPAGLKSWSASDWAVALAGECGEVCEVIDNHFLSGMAAPVTFKMEMSAEIADTYLYLDLFATAFDDSLTDCRKRPGAQIPYELQGYSPMSLAVILAAETGKICDIVKKLNRWRDGLPGNKLSIIELRRELQDRMGRLGNLLDAMAEVCGLKLIVCVTDKFNLVSERLGFPERL